jgi:hypothetical protein
MEAAFWNYAYKKLGLYRLNFQICSDYEIFIRWLVTAKLVYRRIDQVLVHMRPGGLSTSGIRSNILLNREIIQACIDNGLYTAESSLQAVGTRTQAAQ